MAEDAIGFLNYIGGEWRPGATGDMLERRSPADGRPVSRVPRSDVRDARDAAAIAQESLRRQDWSFNPRKRSLALWRWAQNMRANRDALARHLAIEAGKPIREARAEIDAAVNYLEFYAGAARTLYGSSTAVDARSYSILAREPVGVVAVIVPWNFPVTLLMRAAAPALAAGNAIVIKPAEFTSGITMMVVGLAAETGEFPPGILNAITGKGSVVGAELVRSRDVDMISFTGGSDTGKWIMKEAADTMKKVSLELGGKSAHILFDDADLEKALSHAVKGIFTNAGQLCTVGSRLLVQAGVYDRVLEEIRRRTEALRVGHVLDEATEMGPVVSEGQLESVMTYVDLGKRDGRLVTGGARLGERDLHQGCYLAPTVFDELPQDSPVVQEEIFGPVLSVQKFEDEAQAVEMANGTVYGLAAGVWSRDYHRALRVARALKSGTVWVNTFYRLFPEAETGGFKESGIGRASGMEGILEYTEIKHICLEYENEPGGISP